MVSMMPTSSNLGVYPSEAFISLNHQLQNPSLKPQQQSVSPLMVHRRLIRGGEGMQYPPFVNGLPPPAADRKPSH
jgi:hypothetical protein